MTSLTRKTCTSGRIGAYLVAAAALLLPAALLTLAEGAAAQTAEPSEITIYHSLDENGADPRSAEVPAGCTPPTGGTGGNITVVADVNAASNPTFYANVLGDGSNVLAARGNPFPVTQIILDYQTSGASVTVIDREIVAADLQTAPVPDLLIFNQSTFNVPLVHTPAELALINTFVSNGGDVLLVSESVAGDPLSGDFLTFNDFLTGIGSSIQYTGERRQVTGGTSIVTGAPFTTGVTSFIADYYDILDIGAGEAIVLAPAGTPSGPIVATQLGSGPAEPDCVLEGGTFEELKLWIFGGDGNSLEGQTVCAQDFIDIPGEGAGDIIGGTGKEICGAALNFAISGPARFQGYIRATPEEDDGIDTLVFGSPCALVGEGEGPECLFDDLGLKQLSMNFRTGGSTPGDFRRYLVSLLIDSSDWNPDPAVDNPVAISVSHQAAGAKLQLLAGGPEEVASLPVPEPTQLVQLLSGLFGLAGLNRLRRKH